MADFDDLKEKAAQAMNTPDITAQFDKNDIEQNKVMAVLSYLSWLVLIPLLAVKNSPFTRFHVNQGIVLAIVEIIFGIVYSVLTTIFYAISFIFGALISALLGIVSIAFLVLSIMGIVNAINGQAKELPIIGKIKLIK